MTTAPSKPAPFPRYSGIRSPTPDGCTCRWETINAVSQTGGHLGSSLGVVELTVALHYVFDAPSDPIIFDVSHQVYPHKILTGRRSRMPTLRQYGGISGFAKRSESEYDPFGAVRATDASPP